MSGWGNGVRAKQVGTGFDTALVWVNFSDRSTGREVTLSLEDKHEFTDEQMWVSVDTTALRELREHIDEAIRFLEYTTDDDKLWEEIEKEIEAEHTPDVATSPQEGEDHA